MNGLMRQTMQLLLSVVCYISLSEAYDLLTHETINVGGALESTTGSRLRFELGFPKGVEETISGKRVIDWIREGGSLEDNGFRPRNHFHQPLQSPWRDAGLRDFPFFGTSSILWAQSVSQETEESFSWINARQAYLSALVSSTKAEREQESFKAFRSLGQVMHLVVDASVPAHVRNDSHATGDPYEKRVEREAEPRAGESLEDARRRFLGTFATPSFRLDDSFLLKLSILGQDAIDAPVPIARLWDSGRYNGTNPIITLDGQIGITEYTNANFFSQDTVFADQRPPDHKHFSPFPSSADVEAFTDPTNNRKYWRKRAATSGEPQHLAAVSKRLFWQQSSGVQLPPRGRLDEMVHEDYARLLLPRAVGHSAALLDYFFRGKLDVDLVEDPLDSTRFQLVGVNGSSEKLDGGTLRLYSDNPAGVRSQVTTFAPLTIGTIDPGQDLTTIPPSFEAPAEAERFVAVYAGKLGNEAPSGSFPGGVIGKVLGGVRVEEIFADGEEWKVRTPTGVFRLEPRLRVAEYEQVKWGDGANLLVARTTFGPSQPNRVDAFEVPRLPNSVDLATVETPEGPKVPVTPTRSAVLPTEGIAAGTTVNFHQSWSYRQQIVRVQEITITVSCQDGQATGPASITSTAPQLETLATANADFPLTFPIVLDADHYFSNFPLNYAWELVDVGADPSGRLVGLVLVYGTFPDIPTVPVTNYVINRTTGVPVAFSQSFLFASYPQGGDPSLWALVDLSEGRVITSTAEPTMTISYGESSEGSPLLWPDGQVGVAAHTTLVSCQTTDLGWGIRHVDRLSLPPGTVPVVTLRVDERVGDEGFIMNGLLRGDLKSALASAGFVDAQVSTIERTEPVIYICLQSDPVGDCQAVEVDSRFSGASRNPAFLEDARRPSAPTGGERLVLLAKDYTALEIPLAAVVVIEANPLRSQVRYQPGVGVDLRRLSGVTSTLALVTEEDFNTFAVSTSLVSLDGSRTPVVFPDVNLSGSFRMLEPSYLYNVADRKFYRLAPPLQQTALPAKLFELADNPIGEYHAIRVP